MKVDIELEKETHKKIVRELIEKHGDISTVPRDAMHLASERLRAAYSLNINPDASVAQTFKYYSIDPRVWHHFVDNDEELKLERRQTRAEKISNVLKWASENVGEQVTLEKIMEVGDVAYTMAKKITEDRLDVFHKVKRGLFEIHDPEADRKAEREALAAAKAKQEAEESNDDDNDNNDN